MTTQRARTLRSNATDAERTLWRHLRGWRAHGFHIRRQAPIGPYIADFACHRLKLVIELDGGGHPEPEQAAHDQKRDAWLASQGYRVLRFWNNELSAHPEAVLEAIWNALKEAERTPPPTPPR